MSQLKLTLNPIFIATILAGSQVGVAQAQNIKQVITDSTTDFNLRYRLETVDQDGKSEEAIASTLKARVTWASGSVNGFTLNAELDHVLAIGVDDYNDASGTSSKTGYPVVADPTGTDLNQLNITYQGQNVKVVAGRQRIVHGSQRFVGGVAWRQNEQTYDGVRINYQVNDKLALDYSYISDVQRIFGPDGPKKKLEGGFQLFNANYQLNDAHKITGLVYLLDIDGANDPQNTYGMDYQGKYSGLGLHASVATQTFGDYSAHYLAFDASKSFEKVNLTVGFEQLGSDSGEYGFSTPLATAHKFQGFADKFLGTPATGVNDYFFKVATKFAGIKLAGIYHTFSAVEGSETYGTELDLVASYKVHKTTTLVTKFASYSADSLATDTSKFWFMANTKF